MSDDIVVRATNVSKKFCRSLKHVMLYGAKDIGRNIVGLSSRSEILRDGEFWAVDNVSFELRRGETLGIIGPNGSGKSTLLKMLNGIFMPDKGKIEIKGRVGALIEVGAGFHPMLSGRENVYINGAILGMSKKEIDKKFDEIVAFADIGDFIDAPVKHYSSGMYARLGFAVAAHVEPEILLVDEVLSVGDYKFQQKALNKILKLGEEGVATILVTHALHTVRFMCLRAICLYKGEMICDGDSNKTIQAFQTKMNQEVTVNLKGLLNQGSNEVEITNVELFDKDRKKCSVFKSSDSMIIGVEYFAKNKVLNPVIQFGVVRDDNLPCFCGNTEMSKIKIESIEDKGYFEVKVNKVMLTSGKYAVVVIIFDRSMASPYGANFMGEFIVQSDYPRTGKSCPTFMVDYEWLAY